MSNCYWSESHACLKEINQNQENVFIVASNDPTRSEYVELIKKTVGLFELNPIFATDLSKNNNRQAFCDNICSHIISSRLIIIDLSGPILPKCETCSTEYLQFSMNVFWEYGYAAGLNRPIIVVCDQSQVKDLPFDIFDKHILSYSKTSIEEDLGEIIKIKLEEIQYPESNLRGILTECYESLKKICDLYNQIGVRTKGNRILTDNEVFLAVKKIERNKDLCLEYLNLHYEVDSEELTVNGNFRILLEEMDIDVGLIDGRFPANGFYILKTGSTRERMKREEIVQVLDKINKKISQI
ncbi:hypothetical protein LCGC14_0610820 [marine sediment metagenome]|uniref:CD-NTase-associated protein 12/Pycsar effector protein TIR domain-containing protein n=1 Tax=marine sediment metagenome TaxID=412755 RepID=A0A0F9RS08_9ZZZZ|nr:hypothetical protein [bacterium]